ncbi:transcription elongation factor GreA [Spectribacter hydrogenoxidans]|uniref:Transcription elongation factor GreA n=1 Tax=Spectribacter hydrogenoxidans TaxID=3075608 RepID=A0ABU3BXK0_9GAMM|nr:transcription elongation factor GreA [Salinisphaera sp. W335]MDT0633985.1 transcription elongation factor GreA [Salinisphaera sp. W335]
MDKTPLTQRGADALREELKRLKSVERPRIIAAIEEARAHGDLKENAEYHAAKEEQGFIEGRIAEVEGKLGNAQVVDVAKVGAQAGGKIVFGATVEVADENTGDEFTYQIVGEDEADIKSGLLSFASPIARGLIGRVEGDVVDVAVPGGQRTLEVLAVRYE